MLKGWLLILYTDVLPIEMVYLRQAAFLFEWEVCSATKLIMPSVLQVFHSSPRIGLY